MKAGREAGELLTKLWAKLSRWVVPWTSELQYGTFSNKIIGGCYTKAGREAGKLLSCELNYLAGSSRGYRNYNMLRFPTK